MMNQLDEVIRNELHSHQTVGSGSNQQIWRDVSERVTRRRHRRMLRRRTAVALSLVVVLVAAGLSIKYVTSTGLQPPAHQHILDPTAGPGGFSVVPDSGLMNNQNVEIIIHGLHPEADVWITQCVGTPKSFQAGTNQCNAPARMITLDPEGAASVHFAVSQYLSLGGYQVDCASYTAGCSIAVAEADSLSSGKLIANTERLTFAATGPPPPNPLQISATPDGPYANGQVVNVSGTGYPSNASIRVGECPTNTDCGDYFQTVTTSSQGTFSVGVTLHASFTVEVGDADGGESPVQIDCTQPLRCFLMAEESTSPYSAASSIPLVFAAPQNDPG